jgi:4'-phosphopantetheinyl transferase
MNAPIHYEPVLHPVIMPVPHEDRGLSGRARVQSLRLHARRAAGLSAQLGGYALAAMEKDADGVPLPCGGIHWSLTHKATYVAAVVAPRPVGIDLERIKPVSQGMYDRLAGVQEWMLAPQQDLSIFFRYWTAKEAVLKAVGQGLVALSRCRVVQIPDEDHLGLVYDQTPWTVTHVRIGADHLASVTSDGATIEWHLLEK